MAMDHSINPTHRASFAVMPSRHFSRNGPRTPLRSEIDRSVFCAIIGFMLASAFPAMLVYAQELFPTKVGTISGLFFGLAFGLGGIGSGVLGQVADNYGIERVYQICSFLPLIGLLAVLLPNLRKLPRAVPR